MINDRSPLNPLAPYPSLAERDAGDLPEPEMYEGVPPHMEEPLRDWAGYVVQPREDVARSVLARCRVSWTPGVGIRSPGDVLSRLIGQRWVDVDTPRKMQPLDYLNAFINLNRDWNDTGRAREDWINELASLELILRDCGSAWYIEEEFRGLYRRVDETVMESWRQARASAEEAGRPSASRLLAQAWRKIFGMHPESTDGYADAVKAVEAVACPVVFPKGTKRGGDPTVHQARTELRNNGDRWRFALVEKEGIEVGYGSIDVVATMLNRLLRGETERHAIEGRNRPSTQAEAETAIHLAAVLVQWFSRGAIQRRE